MSVQKRLFDVIFSILTGIILAPVFLFAVLAILFLEGRPVFFRSKRMKTPTESFTLWKLRTMETKADQARIAGGDSAQRITPLGQFLRRTHMDEIPQLWNILKGDMSFVGPRPELPEYVQAYPEHFNDVLRCRPGLTGLASLMFGQHEYRILADCETPEETHMAYVRRCLPRKAHLDRIYAENSSVCFDVWVCLRSLRRD